MNEPQVWVLIGVFAAIMVGGFTLSTTLLMHSLKSSIGGLTATMNAKFEAVDAKFEAMDAKFEVVNTKLEHLDRDVASLSKKVFGIPNS